MWLATNPSLLSRRLRLDRIAYLSTRLANTLFDLRACFVGYAFVAESVVVS
jgi:hypothetical protein